MILTGKSSIYPTYAWSWPSPMVEFCLSVGADRVADLDAPSSLSDPPTAPAGKVVMSEPPGDKVNL
jgi:hypothetical protein